MKYIVRTIVDYILSEARCGKGTLRFVLPSYPSNVLVPIGLNLEEALARVDSPTTAFRYGVAYRLGCEWMSGTVQDRHNYEVLAAKGWHNVGDNLTELRNDEKTDSSDCLVVMLAGYEHISDQASLKDFFQMDQQTIWNLCMKRSFNEWVRAKLKDDVNPEGNERALQQIADLLENLCDYGLSDLLGISSFLEQCAFSGATTGDDAYQAILRDLSTFGLPRMIGLARRHKAARSMRRYFAGAQAFFGYGMFLDAAGRDKAVKAIEAYRGHPDDDQPDRDTLGEFKSLSELLDSLTRYVHFGSDSERALLSKADFPFIYDVVLNRKNKITPPKPGIRKLHGLAPEVFLRAIWVALGEFKKAVRSRSALPAEELKSITLRSIVFRHDFEGDEEVQKPVLARDFLRQVLGGIDALLEDSLSLSFGDSQNPMTAVCESSLFPVDTENGPKYTYSATAEPGLRFEVVTSCRDGSFSSREFFWAIPESHQSRLLVDLFGLARDQFAGSGNSFPLFAAPFFGNLFAQHDEESLNQAFRYALHSGRCRMVNLLAGVTLDGEDDTKRLISRLSQSYQMLIEEFRTSGFFAALKKSDEVCKGLAEAYRCHLKRGTQGVLGPLLMKAFMVAGDQEADHANIAWRDFLTCGAATPLHPAVIEMLIHQHAYLCEGFCIYAKRALEVSGDGAFSEKHWNRLVDLAKLQWPIFGTIKDSNRVLDTGVRSYGYIHLVGDCLVTPSQDSGLLLDYDSTEDEDITESELFRQTRDSQLVGRILLDYRRVHAYADDGISIGAYCGGEIQPIIAGVDAYLSATAGERTGHMCSLNLTVIADANDDLSVMRWINAWKDRWHELGFSESRDYYRYCQISVSFKIVQDLRRIEELAGLFRSVHFDVVFMLDFIGSGISRFEPIGDDMLFPEGYRKFPILEKTCCQIEGAGREQQRERVLSNNRFVLGVLHSEVMAHLHFGNACAPTKSVVIRVSDFQPWMSVVDAAHESSSWVVCIDPSIDERLVRNSGKDVGQRGREIIGFGTGVGPHGELNFTVSTEHFSILDIRKKIASQVSLLGGLEPRVADSVAESLVREAAHIGGLSVVKATGPSQYVRDYVSYAMVRKMLTPDIGAFCDELVSLDAYQHWFDETPEGLRPDLLRLQAYIVDGYFNIKAQVIECKCRRPDNPST